MPIGDELSVSMMSFDNLVVNMTAEIDSVHEQLRLVDAAKGMKCYALMRAVSKGFLQGDNPLHFALPLLTIQIALVLLVTRSMALFFRRIKQPRVLAEIIGGVLLGPTALGRNKTYMQAVFPVQSMPLLETVATMGLMFFIFMIGLELDLQALGKTGRKAFFIAVAGIAAPLAASTALASLVKSTVSQGARLGPLILFIGTPLSISAFSVLVRIMAELRLFSTDIGKLATPSVAINDVALWTLLAVGVALAGPKHESLNPVWVLLCGVGFGIIMFTIVRYLMTSVAHRAVKQGKTNDTYVCLTLLCVLLAGLCTDAIGVHSLLGPFLLGLVIPKDNPFPKLIVEKIEDFVTGLMLPLFFASSGLKTNLGSLHGVTSVAFLLLFLATAALGKIAGTFVVARLFGLSSRRAFILGFLMNTKGLGVLIVLNVGRDLKALPDEIFAVLVLTCLLTSFLTFPIVSALCNLKGGSHELRCTDEEHGSSCSTSCKGRPGHCNVQLADELQGAPSSTSSASRTAKLNNIPKLTRILACTDTDVQLPALVNFVEAMRGTARKCRGRALANSVALRLYTLRLTYLSDRPSALLEYIRSTTAPILGPTSSSPRSVGRPANSGSSCSIQLYFPPSHALSKVELKPLPPISSPNPAAFMHLDILKIALTKHASLIILPYHHMTSSSSVEDVNFSAAYANVLHNHPPCSVGILVDSTSMGSSSAIHPSFFTYNVLVLFIGGADDRETLAIALRMADNPKVSVKVIRMTSSKRGTLDEKNHNTVSDQNDGQPTLSGPCCIQTRATENELLDNEAISRIKEKAAQCPQLVCEEHHYCAAGKEGCSLVEMIRDIARTSMGEVHLYMVGRGISNARTNIMYRCNDREGIDGECRSAAVSFDLGVVGDVLLSTARLSSANGHIGVAYSSVLSVQAMLNTTISKPQKLSACNVS